VSDNPPRLFDARLIRQRLARVAPEHLRFLVDAVADEARQRIDLILRDFPLCLVHGVGCTETSRRLAVSGRFGTVISAAASLGAAADVVFDPEAAPLAPQSLDCIVSLLTLQSVNDLPGALIQMRRALKPDGLFLACLFGGATLGELRQAWIEAESDERGGITPRVAPFAEVRDMGTLLQRAGFALPVTDSDRLIARYSDASALMREIRALGLSNALIDRSKHLVSRALLARAAAAYEARFSDPDGRVRATIEIIWLTAWAPHASQPQPLKPGSATARLADALGTSEVRLPRDDD
jgi:SAM-dependent methyltransferase